MPIITWADDRLSDHGSYYIRVIADEIGQWERERAKPLSKWLVLFEAERKALKENRGTP